MTNQQPFWRETPLLETEQRLLAAVHEAHALSCERENVSKLVFQYAAFGSGRYVNGIIGALASLGGPHGPIEATAELLAQEKFADRVEEELLAGRKIPGWGNSFIKDGKDPLWLEVDALFEKEFWQWGYRFEVITQMLHTAGRKIWPNPSAYTAAAALAVGLSPKAAAYLFIQGRLDGWTKLFLQ